MPELSGPLIGLAATYPAGAMINVSVPVDADTRRVTVTVYEYGSPLQLGSAAADVSPGSTTAIGPLYAGTAAAPKGTYYLQVQLCSTSLCNTPLSKNLYDRTNPAAQYTENRSTTGSGTGIEVCSNGTPITTFKIE